MSSKISFSACLSLLASGAWFGWQTPMLPHLRAPESPIMMTSEEASWMVSAMEIGVIISPFPSTFYSDCYGRKRCMLASVPIFFVSLILTIFIKNIISLCFARAIQGFAIGIHYTVLPLYLGEIASPDARGAITSLFHVFWGVGCLFPYSVGPFLSYNMLTVATFGLTMLFALCFMWQPESPYYYALKEQPEKASIALLRLRDHATDESIKKELVDIQLEVNRGLSEKASWRDLIATAEDRRALLLIFVVGLVSYLSGQNAILTYMTETFTEYPNPMMPPNLVSVCIGTVALLGSVLSIFTCDRFGRRFLLLVSSAGCAVSLLVSSSFFYLHTSSGEEIPSYSWITPFGVMAYNFFVTVGLHTVLVTYTSELFPTNTRGLASSISLTNITIWSFIVLKLYKPMVTAFGVHYTYFCYTLTCIVGTVIFYYTMPETKGKTFLEIREDLRKPEKKTRL